MYNNRHSKNVPIKCYNAEKLLRSFLDKSEIDDIMTELSIIMPCYKGEAFIEHSIREVENVVSEFCNSFEMLENVYLF